MKLQELAEDILYLILCLCDVYTVLSVSQTNKSFRRIAYAKNVWLHLIQDLVARKFIDLPSNRALKDSSTPGLIEQVKKIVLGPKTWSRGTHARPIVSQEHRIPVSGDFPSPNFRLLPGGTYLTVQTLTRCELWNVSACALVWSCEHDELLGPRYVELVDDGCSAICLGLETFRVMSVIRIDLNTGDSTELNRVEAPPDTEFRGRPKASGDFYSCALMLSVWPERYFVLGNWRTETTVLIMYDTRSELSQTGGYIFFTTSLPDPPHNLRLSAVSLHAHLSQPTPNQSRSLDAALILYDLPPVVVQDLPFTSPLWAHMVVYDSPLRHDTFKLMIYRIGHNFDNIHHNVRDIVHRPSVLRRIRQGLSTLLRRPTCPRAEAPRTLYTFRFSTADTRVVDWTLTSAAPVVALPFIPSLISYAGYTNGGKTSRHLLNLHERHPRTGRPHTAQDRDILGHGSLATLPDWTLSPYSHAITSFSHTEPDCVISYYV
ncbi:hypothetical protein C8J57DRAFT_1295257 [Mycena rebaudengoi]|nr:hypothetical protein C8J57DRAFT_1295257 [Mycena rebaudengoi]